MKTAIYNCKKCKVGRRVSYPLRDGGRGSFYRVTDEGRRVMPGRAYGADGKATGDALCNCGRFMEWDFLDAFMRADVRCDARCTNARGHKCDCSCGGENHGTGWQVGAAGLFTQLEPAGQGA